MHFFDVNQAKNSENDVKIALNKVEGCESGGVLSTDPSNPADIPQIRAQCKINIWDAPFWNQWMLFHEKMM